MSNNVSQENIQENIQEKQNLDSIDSSFFMTKEQKQRNEENERLKDVKPVYYSITKATKLYGYSFKSLVKLIQHQFFKLLAKGIFMSLLMEIQFI